MAIENHHFLFLVSQLVIIPLLFQHSSFAATQLVNQVCQDTQDSDFCVRTLSADQRSGNADLRGLARIALELSSAQAKGTQDQIQTLLSREPGLDFKSVLDHCWLGKWKRL
ncbi:pectinesterase inhibitor-like [Pistacia vera]|uniref:pectinesterase inhibitor-like n=1 Tax=Pistacia vera TaxID=55513 RepID=UPI001262D2A7|nr:pectinesterase inhibitor-like isoform X2 [Pistacia vera]XP_031288313.1 pectinesterase inhibitor-like [Pistacia vera]